ncbi:MAG TPA: DUF6092 family protein [Gaiellaceae bacterium]|nr:DUF6092 family protein [Gaiellaceae bacterium]
MTDDERLFELTAFLVSSAGLTLVESPRHGAVRLLMAASRLVDSFEPDDPFLRRVKESIDENIVKVMWDYEGLVAWLEDLTREVGGEALARQSRGLH